MKHTFLNLVKVYFFVPLIIISGLVATTIAPSQTIDRSKVKLVDLKQIHCMAINIYYEAGGESIIGQAAVARVVVNRVNHGFGNTPCKVIYQSNYLKKDDRTVKVCQFSWVCEEKTKLNLNSTTYKNALQVAYDVLVLDAYTDVIPKGVLIFHNLTVTPNWPYDKVKRIGNHIFYSKVKHNKKYFK
jgi:spore germination cell wall hydrolase CwlJ-like protein